MAKRILSIVLALIMAFSVFTVAVFAVEESDYNGAFRLTSNVEKPQPGDTVTVTVGVKTDYPSNIIAALIVYDKNYYTSLCTNTSGVSSSYADLVNFTVVNGESLGSAQKDKIYHSSYDANMKAQYGILSLAMTFQASKAGTDYATPVYTNWTDVMSVQFKVNENAPKDGKGLIWMDPVYLKTASGNAKYSFISRGGETLGVPTVAGYGQTIDFSEAVLYKAEEQCKHANTTTINAKAATCTEDGYTGDTYCEDCKTTIANGTTITKTGHQNTKTINAKSATCTEDGYTGDTYCEDCKTVIANGTTITKTGHQNTRTINAVKPTCTVDGYSGDTYCDDCETIIEYGSTLTHPGHTPETDAYVAPTCTDKGLTEGSHCSVCKTVLVAQTEIAPNGHTWGDWYEVTPATLTSTGLQRRDCQVQGCDGYETDIIPMIVATDADYSAVEAALKKIPANLKLYTDKSVAALNAAVDAVVYDLPIEDQALVNGYAQNIESAIAALKLIPSKLADYSELDNIIKFTVPAGSNRTNGVYVESELKGIDALIASFDRQLGTNEQSTVNGYVDTLKAALKALTVDETKAVASFKITTDKTSYKKDDIATVSVALKTNYPIYTMQWYTLYDSNVFQVQNVTSTPSAFMTFTGDLKDAYYTNANSVSSSAMYSRNCNKTYWNTTEIKNKYKIINASWTYDSNINTLPVTLDEEQVVCTFQLKVLTDTNTTGEIFMHSDWIKTKDCSGGAIFAARAVGSELSTIDGAKVEIGQTIDLSKAYVNVPVNAEMKEGSAEITSTSGVGEIVEGTPTVIKVTKEGAVEKVRVINSQGVFVTCDIQKSGNEYTITKIFPALKGAPDVTYTVQYKLNGQFYDIDTFTVKVQKDTSASAEITSTLNTGEVAIGSETVITVTATGCVSKVRLINADGDIVSAQVTNIGDVWTITKQFPCAGEKTYTVQYKANDEWFDIDDITMNVKKTGSLSDIDVQNDGEITLGTETVITATVSGDVSAVRLINADTKACVSTESSIVGSNATLSKTFSYKGAGVEQQFIFQYKVGADWIDAETISVTVSK